jgi:hypothetical protein
VSKDKFESWPYLTKYFYLLGFKTVSPDTKNIKITKNLKVTATYDNPETLRASCNRLVYEGSSVKFYAYNDFEISDGILTVGFNVDKAMDGLIIYSGLEGEKEYKFIILYNVIK